MSYVRSIYVLCLLGYYYCHLGVLVLFFCAMKSDYFLICMLLSNRLNGLSKDYGLLKFIRYSLERCHKKRTVFVKTRSLFSNSAESIFVMTNLS